MTQHEVSQVVIAMGSVTFAVLAVAYAVLKRESAAMAFGLLAAVAFLVATVLR